MNFILFPDIAFVLLVLALLVTIFALLAPGSGVLEVLALILLFIVGYLVANLPVNTWAIALVLIGIISLIALFRRKTQWYFITGSLALLVTGMVFVFRGENSILGVNPLLAVIGTFGLAGFIWIISRNIATASHQEPYSDLDKLVGMIGSASTDISKEGSVYVNGENWSAISDEPIAMGNQIRVIQRNGLMLKVEGVKEAEKEN